MTSELHTPLTLADLIDKELMGVEPDSQCVVLDDADWKMITAALRRYTIEFTRCVSCDGYNCDDGCAYPDTRAVPNVPELERYSIVTNIHGWDHEECEYGKYVRHDQAVAVIADERAKNEQLLKRAQTSERRHKETTAAFERERKQSLQQQQEIKALEAKLAQIEKPIGYVSKSFFESLKIDRFHSIAAYVLRESSERYSEPLYSSPVASDADLRAETIEQCRKAVRNAILRMEPDHRVNGDICDEVIANALATLNPSEPRT